MRYELWGTFDGELSSKVSVSIVYCLVGVFEGKLSSEGNATTGYLSFNVVGLPEGIWSEWAGQARQLNKYSPHVQSASVAGLYTWLIDSLS